MKKNYKTRNKTATSFEKDIIYKTFSFQKNNQMFHRDYRFEFLILFITRSFRTSLKRLVFASHAWPDENQLIKYRYFAVEAELS